MDELSESFDVLLPMSAVWDRLRLPGDHAAGTCRLPGFPSMDGAAGCVLTVDVDEPQRRLGGAKADEPCAGTSIAIEIGPANAGGWPTRLCLVQSGFRAPLADLPDFLNAHWRRIVADFRLYVEHVVVAPPSAWGASLGATTRETPSGLAVVDVAHGSFADGCGMQADDIVMTLANVRVLDTAQLWTVLEMLAVGERVSVTWARGGEILRACEILGGY